MSRELDAWISVVRPVDRSVMDRVLNQWDQRTKPPGSLGVLEDLYVRYVGARGADERVGRQRICVFAADHGISVRGVSAYPREVTGQMVRNMAQGGAAISVLARQGGVDLRLIDVGVAEDLKGLEGVVGARVCPGTRDFSQEAAMTGAECMQAMRVGVEQAWQAADEGVAVLGMGEMGIGNTSSASLLYAALLPADLAGVVGPGTGLDREGLARKQALLGEALARWQSLGTADPFRALCHLGGLEIAAMAGLMLGAAQRSLLLVVDGFIASAAALVAVRLCPHLKGYLVFAHRSAEPGHACLLHELGEKPLLDWGMRLGEGTGAALAMPLLRAASAAYHEMATFAQAGVSEAVEERV